MQMKVDKRSGNIWFTTFGSGTFGVIQKIIGNKADIKSNLNDTIASPAGQQSN